MICTTICSCGDGEKHTYSRDTAVAEWDRPWGLTEAGWRGEKNREWISVFALMGLSGLDSDAICLGFYFLSEVRGKLFGWEQAMGVRRGFRERRRHFERVIAGMKGSWRKKDFQGSLRAKFRLENKSVEVSLSTIVLLFFPLEFSYLAEGARRWTVELI